MGEGGGGGEGEGVRDGSLHKEMGEGVGVGGVGVQRSSMVRSMGFCWCPNGNGVQS